MSTQPNDPLKLSKPSLPPYFLRLLLSLCQVSSDSDCRPKSLKSTIKIALTNTILNRMSCLYTMSTINFGPRVQVEDRQINWTILLIWTCGLIEVKNYGYVENKLQQVVNIIVGRPYLVSFYIYYWNCVEDIIVSKFDLQTYNKVWCP